MPAAGLVRVNGLEPLDRGVLLRKTLVKCLPAFRRVPGIESPFVSTKKPRPALKGRPWFLVRVNGLEPLTSCV